MNLSRFIIAALFGLSLSDGCFSCEDERPSKFRLAQSSVDPDKPVPVAAEVCNPNANLTLESSILRSPLSHWLAFNLTDDSILAPLAFTSVGTAELVRKARGQRKNGAAARTFIFNNLNRLSCDMAIIRDLKYERSPLRYQDLTEWVVDRRSIFDRLEELLRNVNNKKELQAYFMNRFHPLLVKATIDKAPANLSTLMQVADKESFFFTMFLSGKLKTANASSTAYNPYFLLHRMRVLSSILSAGFDRSVAEELKECCVNFLCSMFMFDDQDPLNRIEGNFSVLSMVCNLYLDSLRGPFSNPENDYDRILQDRVLKDGLKCVLWFRLHSGYIKEALADEAQLACLAPALSRPGGEELISEFLNYRPELINSPLVIKSLSQLILHSHKMESHQTLRKVVDRFIKRNSLCESTCGPIIKSLFMEVHYMCGQSYSLKSGEFVEWAKGTQVQNSGFFPEDFCEFDFEWFNYFFDKSPDKHSLVFGYFKNILNISQVFSDCLSKMNAQQVGYALKSKNGEPLFFFAKTKAVFDRLLLLTIDGKKVFNHWDMDNDGNTILHVLSRNNRTWYMEEIWNMLELFKFILNVIPDDKINLKNRDGKTAFNLLTETFIHPANYSFLTKDEVEIVELFKRRGVK